jgi:predicted ribosome quality control (RQC) complex YloA/Tae2 family protein
VAGDGGGADG